MFKLVLLVCVALSSTQCEAFRYGFGFPWFGGFQSVADMSDSIGRSVTDMIGRIQGDISAQFQQINERNRQFEENLEARFANAANFGDSFDAGSDGAGGAGEFTSFTSNSGSSRSIRTGISKNGEAYRQESEEARVGDNLYRVEKFYNLKNGTITIIKTTINLADINASPIVEKSVISPKSSD